ncbi:MAG: S-layer homology domain-containing protein [Firmicutes bacterium]|nr:S-layer homology domain-containing protein [Bacillota bacterium]
MKIDHKYIKRLMAVFLTLVVAFGTVPAFAYEGEEAPAADNSEYYFTDVPEGSYFFDAVYWALDRYVTNGTGPDTFSPEKICTRAQVMTFLWRAKGNPEPASRENLFRDVPKNSYYEQAVLWAVGEGITNGTSATAFSPDKVCNYAEILTFLWRANGMPAPEGDYIYPLGHKFSWYSDAVTWAGENALLEDFGDGFDPMDPCTRARTVTWLYRDAQVYVSTVEELANAIGPGRDIHLAPGTYNLTKWMNSAAGWDNPYVSIVEVSDGAELQISGLKNTEFLGSDGDASFVKIVAEPRYANVLSFYDCDNIMLTDLTLGHTTQKGKCAGGVIGAESCGELWLEGLDLYGCGAYGITVDEVMGIYAEDCVVRDCSEGLVQCREAQIARFSGCQFRNTKGQQLITAGGDSWLIFDECGFRNLSWSKNGGFLDVKEDSAASFYDCSFPQSILRAILNDPGYDKNIFVREEDEENTI